MSDKDEFCLKPSDFAEANQPIAAKWARAGSDRRAAALSRLTDKLKTLQAKDYGISEKVGEQENKIDQNNREVSEINSETSYIEKLVTAEKREQEDLRKEMNSMRADIGVLRIFNKFEHQDPLPYSSDDGVSGFVEEMKKLKPETTDETVVEGMIQRFEKGGGFFSRAFKRVVEALPEDAEPYWVSRGVFDEPRPKSKGFKRFLPRLKQFRKPFYRTPRKLMARLLFYCGRLSADELEAELKREAPVEGVEDFDGLFKLPSGKKPADAEHDEAPVQKKARLGDNEDGDDSDHHYMV